MLFFILFLSFCLGVIRKGLIPGHCGMFRGIMGCSRGVLGLFRAVPGGVLGVFWGCSGGVPGVFRGCSGVFRGVPGFTDTRQKHCAQQMVLSYLLIQTCILTNRLLLILHRSTKPGTWNIPERPGTFWNISEHSGTSRNRANYHKINEKKMRERKISRESD